MKTPSLEVPFLACALAFPIAVFWHGEHNRLFAFSAISIPDQPIDLKILLVFFIKLPFSSLYIFCFTFKLIPFNFNIFGRKEQVSTLYQNINLVEPRLIQPYEHVIRNFLREIKLQSTEMENLAIAVKRYQSASFLRAHRVLVLVLWLGVGA